MAESKLIKIEDSRFWVDHDPKGRLEQMEQDKLKRENVDFKGMIKQERAGMSEEDIKRKGIIKLDETNNESYAYLRSVGNMYQYYPEECHTKLKARLYRRFDTFDKNSDGTMQMSEVLYWANRMKALCNCSDEDCESVKSALRIFFGGCGLSEEVGLQRENWVEANQAFAEAERERKRRGEPSIVALLGNAYYDVLDEDKDNIVSMQELKRMMNVFRVPEEAAYTFHEHADKNKDGQLQREEMHEVFTKFWLSPYDPTYDGIYAYKY